MLNVRQAAERLGISTALVYALVASRKLRHERHGLGRGTIRLTKEALEEYRRGVTVEAVATPPPPTRRRKLRHLS